MVLQRRKLTGEWRHCYDGQEANLLAPLDKAKISLSDFNAVWDDIERWENPLWRKEKLQWEAEDADFRQEVSRRILRMLQAGKGEEPPFNVFVPVFAPQYVEMVNRGGIPGMSLEDSRREGVWVPRQWLEGTRSTSIASTDQSDGK